MIRRNAEKLYWIGRYMERAESHSRWLDLSEEITEGVSSREHIYSCIGNARHNIRVLRQLLPNELWELANELYLYVKEQESNPMLSRSPHLFYRRVREGLLLWGGAVDSGMPRDQEYHFIQAGRSMERAANTLQLIRSTRSRFPAESNNGMVMLLRSIGAYEAYRRHSSDNLAFGEITAFLLTHVSFPRTVHYALTELDKHLTELGGVMDFRLSPEPAVILSRLQSMGEDELLEGAYSACFELGNQLGRAFIQEERAQA
ncbi:alpha-E domain-containing protein [Paenibacillus sp. GCM10023252]|uniref:alpha-E domain-containing protein n=1 Tax=Paenibacillus sp. GCM10023252 TaxID=3252649 RepID=UPI003622037F